MNRRTLLTLLISPLVLEARASESALISAKLRDLALRTKAIDLGLNTSAASKRPWGLIVDVARIDAGVLTIACMADGNTSLYFSQGGGVLGAGRDPAVRSAATLLLDQAADHAPSMNIASSTTMPPPGSVAFFVLAPGGPYHAAAIEHTLENGSNKLAPLYRQSQAVFRAVQEAQLGGRLK